jgi:hypothetical protein
MQNRQMDLTNYYQQMGAYNTNNQNALNNYQTAFDNYNTQRNQYASLLSGMAGMGQNATSGLSGMLQNNANTLADAYSGYGSSQAQNAWNQAQATSKSIGSGMSGLGSMFNGMTDLYNTYNNSQSGK